VKQIPILSAPYLTQIHLRFFFDRYLCLHVLIPFVFQSPRPLLRKAPLVLNLSWKAQQKKRRYRSFPRLDREKEFFGRISGILVNKEGKNVYRLFPCRRLSRLQKIRRREKRLFLPHLRGLYLRGLRKEKQRRLSPLFFAAGKIQLILSGSLPRPVFSIRPILFLRAERIANRNEQSLRFRPQTVKRNCLARGQGKTSYPLI